MLFLVKVPESVVKYNVLLPSTSEMENVLRILQDGMKSLEN